MSKERLPDDICGYSSVCEFGTFASSSFHSLLDLMKKEIPEGSRIRATINSFTNKEGDNAYEKCKQEGLL